MQVNKNFRWYRPENRQYYIMIQNELQAPKALQDLSSQIARNGCRFALPNTHESSRAWLLEY